MHLRREIVLFAIGGLLGLAADAGIVQSLVGLAHWNPYTSRVVSFLAAATVTWWWNRRYTFSTRESGRSAGAEWLHWMGLMMAGAVINNGIYVLALGMFEQLHRWPAIAVAAGSAAGAAANFVLARGLLFKGAKSSL